MNELYSSSQALLTDLYQLTMAYGYWRHRIHERRAVFHLFFRRCPFGGKYAVSAGLATAIEWLTRFRVQPTDVDYLRTLTGNNGQPLFAGEFLDAIRSMTLDVDVDAMVEGTLVFAHQPILRITGPLWQCQWIETALLNIVNFQTLIATKAARVCDAADGDSVLEFGLRRAQGIDGGISASRAAYIGGCSATSNVRAGQLLGIPVRGTHAHSWVMSFDDETEAFEAYADAMPNNCVFLVDTYDTIEGVRRAIDVGISLRRRGHQMVGVRLDSGDLATLSIEARRMLDADGFDDAVIVASNDLDEYEIKKLKGRGATIAVWGVGTRLVTAGDQPALGGVYKLGAIEDADGDWKPRIKRSEISIKTSTPGIQQVRRYQDPHRFVGDILFSEMIGPPESRDAVTFSGEPMSLGDQHLRHEDLLKPIVRGGQLVAEMPDLSHIRQHAADQLSRLSQRVRSLERPTPYPVGLECRLDALKRQMIDAT